MKPLLLPFFLGLTVSICHAGSGTWGADASGNWNTPGSWASSTIADGIDSNASFTNDITTDRVVTLDGPRTVGSITFGDAVTTTAGSWIISGANTLTLATTTGTPTITVNALGTAKSAKISTVIAGTAGFTEAGAGPIELAGANTVTGGIKLNGNGSVGNAPGMILSGTNAAQTWTVSDASFVAGVLVTNSGAFASGSILNVTSSSTNFPKSFGVADNTAGIVGSGSTMNITTSGAGRSMLETGTNTNWGASINISGTAPLQLITGTGATISGNLTFATVANALNIRHDSGIPAMTGVTKSNAGPLTISGNLVSSVAGAGPIGAPNSFTGTLVLSGNNSAYSGNITTAGNTLSFANATNLGTGILHFANTTTAGTLTYTGAGSTIANTVNLNGTTGGMTVNQSGTGLLKFTNALTATGAGIKTLTLQGSTTGTGEIAGAIVENSGTNKTSVTKAGTGAWTLSGANTYTGATTVNAGTLNVTGTLNFAVTVNSTATLMGTGSTTGALTLNNGSTISGGLPARCPAITGPRLPPPALPRAPAASRCWERQPPTERLISPATRAPGPVHRRISTCPPTAAPVPSPAFPTPPRATNCKSPPASWPTPGHRRPAPGTTPTRRLGQRH